MTMGTPEYMAPEQILGERVGPTTDVYALGVVGFHCLAGAPPFAGGTALEVAARHVQQVAPPLPQPTLKAARRL